MPWREIVGMRNRLIHGYISVDLHIVNGLSVTQFGTATSAQHLGGDDKAKGRAIADPALASERKIS